MINNPHYVKELMWAECLLIKTKKTNLNDGNIRLRDNDEINKKAIPKIWTNLKSLFKKDE